VEATKKVKLFNSVTGTSQAQHQDVRGGLGGRDGGVEMPDLPSLLTSE